MRVMRKEDKTFVKIIERKGILGRPRRRWEDSLKKYDTGMQTGAVWFKTETKNHLAWSQYRTVWVL
jgi:hypothetical protein